MLSLVFACTPVEETSELTSGPNDSGNWLLLEGTVDDDRYNEVIVDSDGNHIQPR